MFAAVLCVSGFRGELDDIPEAETVAGGRVVYDAWWCGDAVEVSGLDAGGETENGGSQGRDVAFEGAVVGVEIAFVIEPVAFFRRLAVEEAFCGDVGDRIVVIDVAVDTETGVGQDAIAKRGVADARASEGVERDGRIGEPAVGEDGESGSEAVTGETDFGLRMLGTIAGDERVDFFPDLVQGVLEAAVDEGGLLEEVADEGEVSERGSGVLGDGAIVGFVDKQNVGVGEEIVGIVSLGAAKGA